MGRQDTIAFRLDCDLGQGLRITRLNLIESLDQPYVATVVVSVDEADPDPTVVLGGDAVIEIERLGVTRRVCGLVRAASTLHGDSAAGAPAQLRLEIVPALWMLSLRTNTRMFQNKTVPEILEAVLSEDLGPYSRSVQNELQETYPAREYCLQYGETDLQFAHRLMEEEGISYAFDHAGEVEVMVLRDSNKSYPVVEGSPVPLEPNNFVIVDRQPVHRFERVHGTTTTSVALRDFDWTKGGYIVEDAAEGEDAAGRSRESYEHGHGRSLTIGDYSGTAYGQNDAARQKLVRQQAHSVDALIGRGHGRVIGFCPGTTFELAGHPMAGVDGQYLITRVRHASAALENGTDTEPYHNRFECIPIDVPHRPARRAAKPRIAGIQTGVVTGPSGEEIHTDEHGRIKVQFHWDRENPADDTSSCWIRVQQKWAGSGWGFWWLPRVGMEVVVQFIDGDPDRPLVTGTVYNGANGTPYPLPDDKTKSTIKSNSSPGGGGSNELRFEDKAGSEEIYAHAQKDYNEVVENDHTTLVHNDQTNTVDADQTQTVHANQTERVDGNQDLSVGGDRTVHVESNFDETVDGTETRHVAGAVDETFDANETRTISGNVTEDISAGETRTVGAGQTETIVGNQDVSISASSTVTIGGARSETVAAGITLTTPASWSVTATGGYTAVAAGGLTIMAPGGLRVGAPGGVQQIDSVATVICSMLKTDGGFQRALTGVKTEAYGVFITLVPYAKGAGISEMMLGPQLMTKASILQTALNKLAPGAIKLGAGPSSDE